MTNKFKVGDKVRRLPQYQDIFNWNWGAEILTVERIDKEGYLIFPIVGIRDPSCFELVEEAEAQKPLLDPKTTQVGGDHYKTLSIQPTDYICANGLGWCEGNIVKYITRWKQKGGVQDIEKVIHYAELLKGMQNESSP